MSKAGLDLYKTLHNSRKLSDTQAVYLVGYGLNGFSDGQILEKWDQKKSESWSAALVTVPHLP